MVAQDRVYTLCACSASVLAAGWFDARIAATSSLPSCSRRQVEVQPSPRRRHPHCFERHLSRRASRRDDALSRTSLADDAGWGDADVAGSLPPHGRLPPRRHLFDSREATPRGSVGTYPKDVDLMWTRLTRQKGRCGLHRERRADRPETREPYRHSELLTIHGERSSDDLLVVAGVDVSVGIRGMRPVHGRQLAAIAGRGGWLQKLGAADLLKSLGRQRCDDELAAIVV